MKFFGPSLGGRSPPCMDPPLYTSYRMRCVTSRQLCYSFVDLIFANAQKSSVATDLPTGPTCKCCVIVDYFDYDVWKDSDSVVRRQSVL